MLKLKEIIIYVAAMIYVAIVVGTILKIDERISLLQMLFLFFCLPPATLVCFVVWAVLQLEAGRVKACFKFFSGLPVVCEELARRMLHIPRDE